MAFPQVSDADTTNGSQTTNSNSWTITYPANIAAGDLLLLLVGIDGGTNATATGFTVLLNRSGGVATLTALGLIAAGSETGTFSLSLDASEKGAWRVLRITAASWYGGTLTAGTGTNASDGVSATSAGYVATANPNPAARTPAWGSADDLWFAIVTSNDGSHTISAYPTNYTNGAYDGGGTTDGAMIGAARRELAAASEDPGTFTISASTSGAVATMAIRPAVDPNVVISPTAASLTLTGSTPTISVPRTVAPTAASLTITGSTPTVRVPRTIAPTAASLTLTGATPTVSVPRTIAPSAASLTLTGATPTVSVPRTISPAAAALALSFSTPTVSVPRTISPTPLALLLSLSTPSVVIGAGITVGGRAPDFTSIVGPIPFASSAALLPTADAASPLPSAAAGSPKPSASATSARPSGTAESQ